jgi:zinc protease
MKYLVGMTVVLAGALAVLGAKETPPPGGPPKPFHLPATEDFALSNGMNVTLAPYGVVPRVAVRAYIDAGGVDEPADEVWISRLNAMLLKEGTRTRGAEQVAQEVADMGGQLESEAGPEFATIGGVVLSDSGPKFVRLLAEILQTPALPASEVPRLKADLRRELAVEKSKPESQARECFFRTLFPDHPYGRLYPSDSALHGYSIENIRKFYSANFGAGRTHLYIAGKLAPGLREAVREAFGNWERGKVAAELPAKPVRARSLQLIDRPGAPQSTLYLGLPVAEPASPDYIPLEVMDSMLGGSFVSRITSNIREQKGYTYSPFSQVGTRRHLAYWVEIADVTTEVTGPSLHEIFSEIDRMRKEAPSAQELTGIRNYLAGLFVIRNTISPDTLIRQLQFVDSQNLNRSFLLNYIQKVMTVTPGDIQRLAENYIVPSQMTIVVVGDRSKIAEQLKPYETGR